MMKIKFAIFCGYLMACSLLLNAQPDILSKSRRYLVFTQSEEIRNLYDINNIAWGFLPFKDVDDNMNTFIGDATKMKNEGRTFHGRIEYDGGWKSFAQFCVANGQTHKENGCKTIEGNSVHYPWFPDTIDYWISHHSPTTLAWLKWQVEHVLQAPIKAILFDAQASSAMINNSTGDFSSHCMTAFRAYLKNKYTTQELSALGISNIDVFDYRTFLIDMGISSQNHYTYRVEKHDEGVKELPLIEEYRLFQNISMNELITQMNRYADSIAGFDVAFGTSSRVGDPYLSSFTSEFDFYTLEQSIIPNEKEYDPILTYKLSENINKVATLTAWPQHWGVIKADTKKWEMARGWLANGYANGANFIFPENQFWHIGMETMGHFSPDDRSGFTELSHLIKDNEELFDDYKPIKGKVAVIHSREAARKKLYDLNSILRTIKLCNIPYDIVVVGDDYYPTFPTVEQLNAYDKVIVASSVFSKYISSEPSLTGLPEDKLVKWATTDPVSKMTLIKNQLSATISVNKYGTSIDEYITVFPRINEKSPSDPYVLHLINDDYNTTTNIFEPKINFKIEIDDGFFEDFINSAYYIKPDKSPIPLYVKRLDGQTIITGIDEIDVWGIVKLIHSQSDNILNDTGVKTHSDFNLNIYPNPSDGGVHIEVDLSCIGSRWSLVNSIGQIVKKGVVRAPKFIIEIENSGIYHLIINNNSSKTVLINK